MVTVQPPVKSELELLLDVLPPDIAFTLRGREDINDLLEVVMGPLEDNDGIVEEKDIALVDEQKFEIKGNTSIEEINRTLGLSVPEGDYNSIAGLLLEHLGHIPTETETLTLDNITITVAHVRGVKIERVLLSIHAPTNSNVI